MNDAQSSHLTGHNYIFISFEKGGGGHRLGRVLCTLPDVYWFSSKDNGIHPWNVHFEQTNIGARHISRYHFDRTTPLGMFPPSHDYIAPFSPDAEEYYNTHYIQQFNKINASEILRTHKVVLCTHSLPDEIHARFPDAKVINIVTPTQATVDRYLKTTAIFPSYLKHHWLDGTNTEFGRKLKAISEIAGNGFTVRDVWAYDAYGEPYDQLMESEYNGEVYDMISANMLARRNNTNKAILTTDKRDYKGIKAYIK